MVSPVEIALLALLGILWGMPYALTKIALTTILPITLVAARVAVAATLMLGIYPRLLFQVAEASARTLGAGGISASLR